MAAIITPITMPFASARTSGTLPNVLPATTPSVPDDVANQSTGFPVLQAEPLGTPSATPVNEAEMNGVLNFYTNKLFQLGQGYQFTFDSTLSTTIGGYSAGAILWCASNNTYQVSLVNNNTFNFVSTPSYINDGVHWSQLDELSLPDIIDEQATGNVTIGGRITNALNRIYTIGPGGVISNMYTNNGNSYFEVTNGSPYRTRILATFNQASFEVIDPAGGSQRAVITANISECVLGYLNPDNSAASVIGVVLNQRPTYLTTNPIASYGRSPATFCVFDDMNINRFSGGSGGVSGTFGYTMVLIKMPTNTAYIISGNLLTAGTTSSATIGLGITAAAGANGTVSGSGITGDCSINPGTGTLIISTNQIFNNISFSIVIAGVQI